MLEGVEEVVLLPWFNGQAIVLHVEGLQARETTEGFRGESSQTRVAGQAYLSIDHTEVQLCYLCFNLYSFSKSMV